MIDLDGLHVDGVSVGGFASTLDLPELKVCVDLGVLLDRCVARDVVLLTHAHADHLGSFAQHVAQRALRGMPPARYVVPPGIEDDVHALLDVWRRLDRGELPAEVLTLAPGDELSLRRDLVVRPFATVHRVPSQGYLFERVAKRLRPAYRGRTEEEIVAARREGAPVDEETRESVLAVTGDTTIAGLVQNPEVLRARRLVVEATFLDDRVSPERAERLGHVHIDHLAAIADDLECRALLVQHVSPRHSRDGALRLVRERLPASLVERTQVMVAAPVPDPR
ncbi:MAG: MBL fold metallo-hydrolase [Planctomycetota bacterium]